MIVRHILPGAGLMPADLNADSMSGLVGAAYNFARQQAMRGWNVELWGLARPGTHARSFVSPEGVFLIPVHPWRWCHLPRYDFRYYAPVAMKLALRRTADIHHVYSNPYHLRIGHAHKRVLHLAMAIPETTRSYVKAAQLADVVICCSKFIREQFLQRVPYPQERVRVVYNGVDLDRFTPGDKGFARTVLGLPTDETVIVYAGAVHEDKGLIHLVRALKLLTASGHLRLLVAGSADLWGDTLSYESSMQQIRTSYEETVRQEAQSFPVTFLGSVAQARMPLVFQAADIAVCPSVCEDAMPLSNLEAMATGLPVIGSNVGGIPEVVLDGVTGFLVPPGDPAALADRLDLLLTRPELRVAMGQNALRFVQPLHWRYIAKQVERLYLDLRHCGKREIGIDADY
ncbi:MAG: glycosyltransferase family 4 protein [Anaerolineae bacterium]